MLIHGALQRGSFESSIKIPYHLCETLSFDSGSCVWASYVSQNEYNEITCFLTSIDPIYWPFLWRFELDVVDGPGIFDELIELIIDYKLTIIMGETSKCDVLGNHTISIIVAANSHTALVERNVHSGRNEDRDAIRRMELLLAEVKVNFIEHLAVRSDNRTRIRLRPIDEYIRLSQLLLEQQIEYPRKTKLINNCLELTDQNGFCQEFREKVSQYAFNYLPIADTKDRVIKLHLVRVDRDFRHLRITLRRDLDAIHSIFHHLRERGWDCEHIKLHNGRQDEIEALKNTKNFGEYITVEIVGWSKNREATDTDIKDLEELSHLISHDATIFQVNS